MFIGDALGPRFPTNSAKCKKKFDSFHPRVQPARRLTAVGRGPAQKLENLGWLGKGCCYNQELELDVPFHSILNLCYAVPFWYLLGGLDRFGKFRWAGKTRWLEQAAQTTGPGREIMEMG